MKFFVCFQNCVGNGYCENAPSLSFDSLDKAVRYLTDITEENIIPIPDVRGAVRWFFPSCASDGILYDPDPDIDTLSVSQIINIIPGDERGVEIEECGRDDENAVLSLHRYYMLDCDGRVSNVKTSEIKPSGVKAC